MLSGLLCAESHFRLVRDYAFPKLVPVNLCFGGLSLLVHVVWLDHRGIDSPPEERRFGKRFVYIFYVV